MLRVAGVTLRAVKTSDVTVSVAGVDVTPENIAVISAAPTLSDDARPFEPAVLLTVATVVFDEVHVAQVVRFCMVMSARVPVAVNCCLYPLAILGLDGVIAMVDTADTVSVVVPGIPP